MAETKTFIRFDGRLWEDMTFERRPGWETERLAHRSNEGDQGYSLDLLDDQGRLLVTVSPDVDFTRATTAPMDEMTSARVTAYVPLHADARELVFRRGDIEIHREPISPDPPSIRLGAVRHRKNGTIELRWMATHPGGRSLTFNVVYLTASGRGFSLARDLTETAYTADLSSLPGGKDGRISVLATDGARSAFIVSDPIDVPEKPEVAWINQPSEGEVLPPDQPVSLRGLATDVAGAPLPDESLRWLIDANEVAVGERTALTSGLEPGRHTATLEYAPGATVAASATVRFRIAPRNDLEKAFVQGGYSSGPVEGVGDEGAGRGESEAEGPHQERP